MTAVAVTAPQQRSTASTVPEAIGKQRQTGTATVSAGTDSAAALAMFEAMLSGFKPNPRNCGHAAARALAPATVTDAHVHVVPAATSAANSKVPPHARAVPVVHAQLQQESQSHGDQMSEEEGDEEDDDDQQQQQQQQQETTLLQLEPQRPQEPAHHSPAVAALAVQSPALQISAVDDKGPDAAAAQRSEALQLPPLRYTGTRTGTSHPLNIHDKNALIAQLTPDDYNTHCASTSSQSKKTKDQPPQGQQLVHGTFDLKLPCTADLVCTAHEPVQLRV